VNLVGFIIRIYHDARSFECQKSTHFGTQLPEHESEYNAKVCKKWRFNAVASMYLDPKQRIGTGSHEKKTCALRLTV